MVTGREPKLVKLDRFAGSEDTHDHILDATRSRDRGNTQLNIEGAVLFELDLAILWPTLLGDIKITHDLDPGDQG